jgi:hypothetical protein
VLDKTLYGDVPFFLPGVNDGNLRLMKAITGTLGASAIPRLKDDSTGDFAITSARGTKIRKLKIEVGGVSNKIKGADYVIRDDIDYPSGKALPLWLLGMGW